MSFLHCDLTPEKGRFSPGEALSFTLENPCGADRITLTCRTPNAPAQHFSFAVTPGSSAITLPAPALSWGGVGVSAALYRQNMPVGEAYTAADISAPGRLVRYGFLSDFTRADAADASDLLWLRQLHINTVQFYDWSYRHDQLVAPCEDYADMMGKRNSLTAVKAKIALCHTHGMRATAYGAVYAASRAYQAAHPRESLTNAAGEPLCFLDTFFLMNPAQENPWFSHILQEYEHAVCEMGFDGIHMDTYGAPKAALDADGKPVWLEKCFPVLIEAAWDRIQTHLQHPCMVFNNVGGWPADVTQTAPQSCVYLEIWPPVVRYAQLGMLIEQAGRSGKPVVLAAYPAMFRTDTPERALEGELLLSFVIAMHGATQLCFGESGGVITQGYYADYTVLSEAQRLLIRAYQDFFVQYEALLFDPSLRDVSLTHQGWDNREYRCDAPWSADGESGALWMHLREDHSRKMLCLVNLSGGSAQWNAGRVCPAPLERIGFTVESVLPVRRVWFASPDVCHGVQTVLESHTVRGKNALETQITLPALQRCGILVLETEEPA